jgi:23S rRNA U2552 (ribose-2'-O)-methylase RlmE/FtsJ
VERASKNAFRDKGCVANLRSLASMKLNAAAQENSIFVSTTNLLDIAPSQGDLRSGLLI